MAADALTYGAIGTGFMLFVAAYGVYDSRSKRKAEEAKQYADDQAKIYKAIQNLEHALERKIENVESVSSAKNGEVHQRTNKIADDLKDIYYKVGCLTPEQ